MGQGLQRTGLAPGRDETRAINPLVHLLTGRSVSRRCPEPRRFVEDPASLAHDSMYTSSGMYDIPITLYMYCHDHEAASCIAAELNDKLESVRIHV